MISFDTNVLVRAFLDDDREQSTAAQKFLKESSDQGKVFISSYALLEFAWVLKVKKFTRKEIVEAILTLVDSPGVTIGQKDVLLEALDSYVKGKADFGDHMILAESRKNGVHEINTFDQKFLKDLEL